MRWRKKYWWYILDMAVFTALNATMLTYVVRLNDLALILNPFTLLLLGIAVYRSAHIISNEEVTKALRAPFTVLVHRDGKDVEEPKADGLRGAVGALLYCPSCVGVWLAAIFLYAYLLFPNVTAIIAAGLTLSAIERLISNVYDLLKSFHKET